MPNKELRIFLLVVVVVLSSRLPIIQYGYGNDADAWGAARTAKSNGTSGEYHYSRPPGHPLQELICASLWDYGPIGLNGVTALLSALGAAFFALSLRVIGARNYILAGLALAFTPIVWIHSTDLMDYVWALAFITASLYYILCHRIILGGLLLALAVSCRLTSIAMIVPLSVFIYREHQEIRPMLLFGATSVLLGIATYVPAILVHQRGVLTVWEYGYPKLHTILYMSTVQVWGLLGTIAIGCVMVYQILCAVRTPLSTQKLPKHIVISSLSAIVLFTIIFLRLPHEPGYLIPVVPFIILLLHGVLSEKTFVVICVCIIGSSLIGGLHQKLRIAGSTTESGVAITTTVRGIDLVLDLAYGPVLYDAIIRQATIGMVDRVVDLNQTEMDKVVFVAGGLIAHIDSRNLSPENRAVFTNILDEKRSRYYNEEGIDIYYMEDIVKRYNHARNGLDLESIGAKFIAEHPRLRIH